ncbi:MAG: hydroxyethylthiazole kinase [Propionibacteriaceae bacterium]
MPAKEGIFMENSPVSIDLAACLSALRKTNPLTQCLTNIVVANFTANVLLAAGASPAMVDNPAEAAAFAQIAGGTLLNVGTPYDQTAAAMRDVAQASSGNWVLDVVGYGLPWRSAIVDDCVAANHPAIIRGNASEILTLAGAVSQGKGCDAGDETVAALPAAQELARQHHCTVAVSGPVDYITDGTNTVTVSNGHPWMTLVTGVGCSLGGLMAAYTAVCETSLEAAAAATAHLCVAAEHAAAESRGPGSFAVALIDHVTLLTPTAFAQEAVIGRG